MITFLPFPDFEESAAALDARRLGKQRVEALQLLHGLLRRKCEGGVVVAFTGVGHVHHPASKMWRGYEPALAAYTRAVCRRWTRYFGHADTVDAQVVLLVPGSAGGAPVVVPPWLGDPAVHASHRGNLVRKDPLFYGRRHGWTDSPALAYVWPVK